MGYVIYETKTGYYHNAMDDRYGFARSFATLGAAKAALTRYNKKAANFVKKLGRPHHRFPLLNPADYTICPKDQMPKFTKIVKNMMSGEDVEIDVNTENCCNPASETYWSC